MGRPPKRSTLPYQDLENLQLWMNANQAESLGIPEQAEHLQLVVAAVLVRLQRGETIEHEPYRRLLATIANLEAARFASKERIAAEIERECHTFVWENVSRCTHDRQNLRTQRGLLLDYFLQEKYPSQSDKAARKWLKARWSRMTELLAMIPCGCRYSLDVESFLQMAKDRVLVGDAEVSEVILASVHNTTIQNVRKLLKPA